MGKEKKYDIRLFYFFSLLSHRRDSSDQEYNKSEFIDKNDVAKKIKSGKDLFNRKDHFYIAVPLSRKFPRYIVENKKRFNHLICPVSITKAFLRLIYHKKSLARFIKYW